MKKNNFHKFNIFLLIILFLFFFFSFSLVEAQEGTTFTPQTTIPGSKFEAGQALEISGSSFVDYLVSFYQWAVGAIAILAVIMIMVAGFQWMAASGNATSISKAKGRISNSLVGLLLAVGAYSLLNFINPSLVNLRTLNIGEIEGVSLASSTASCENGYYVYGWDNHICYGMGRDDYKEEYLPIWDFVEMPTESVSVNKVSLGVGVSAGTPNDCNSRNNFDGFVNLQHYDLDCNPGTNKIPENVWLAYAGNWSEATLMRYVSLLVPLYDPQTFNSDVDRLSNFYGFIKDDVAGVMVSLDCGVDNFVSGIKLFLANKTPGGASAYIKNIKLSSDKSCLICCKSGDTLLYDYSIECPWGNEVLLTECDNRYCDYFRNNPDDCFFANGEAGLMEEMCKGVAERCDGVCEWRSAGNLYYRCYRSY